MSFRAAFAAFALLSFSGTAQAQGTPGDFDFYLLSLSWSPAFCALDGNADQSEQCEDGPSGFVTHGLWPQYERGFPEYCEEVDRPPRDVVDEMLDIMPDRGLVRREWRKHGSCTDLSAEDYFAETRAAYERVAVPDDVAMAADGVSAQTVEAAFVAKNPGMSPEGIAVSCRDGFLLEVRICLTRDLAFRDCAEVDERGCHSRRLIILPSE